MTRSTGMTDASVLMDVGSGLCRPLIHALATGRVTACLGVEIDHVKCRKARAFITLTTKRIRAKGMNLKTDFNLEVVCSGIEGLSSIGSTTHIYTFWEGVPADARIALGKLFRESPTTTAICVVQRAIRHPPAEFMADYGFGRLLLVEKQKVMMSGSRSSFTAYIFVKHS